MYKTTDLCGCGIAINCDCKKLNKIPVTELRFVYLQGKVGKLGAIKSTERKKMTKMFRRKNRNINLTVHDDSKLTCSQ